MNNERNILLVSILCAMFVLVAGSASFGGVFDKVYAANVNIEDEDQILDQDDVNCDITAFCDNIAAQNQALNIFDVINAFFINQDDVTNSAEIEQELKQVNENCDDVAFCQNIAAQNQVLNTAAVINAFFINQDDVTNSAEVEQEAEQLNENCDDVAFCQNIAVKIRCSIPPLL